MSSAAHGRPPRNSRICQFSPEPSEHERELLYLLACGEAHGDIAAKFGINGSALNTRLWRLRELFEVTSTVELVALALRRHWIE